MKAAIGFIIALALVTAVSAQGIVIRFVETDPSTAGFKLYHSTTPSNLTVIATAPYAGLSNSLTIATPPTGLHYYAVSATNIWGMESQQSNTNVINTTPPVPPTSLTINPQ